MLTYSNLTFSYADKPVLDQFNLSLPAEGITAFNGPSGCGKTTLLRLTAGLETPASGSVEGIAPSDTAMLFQEDRLLPWRTVRQHLLDGLPKGASLPQTGEDSSENESGRVRDWLAFAELSDESDSYPDQLSGGMARRLALARCCISCLIHGGKLLLLDEPFTGVDQQRRARLIERLRHLGIPVLLASHEQDVLDACDRVISLEGPPLRLSLAGGPG